MRQKGQIFILSVLILSGVVTLGLILITAFTGHLHLSVESQYSLQAFYLADSKAEVELYNKFKGEMAEIPNCNCSCENHLDNCPSFPCWLKTTATYKGVIRSTEYNFGG